MSVLIGSCILSGIVGWLIGDAKGRPVDGFALGLLLGPIGVIAIAVMSRSAEAEAKRNAAVLAASAKLGTAVDSSASRACPWCAEQIQPAAIVCRFCGRDVATGQPA